jgi:hypothetical protein
MNTKLPSDMKELLDFFKEHGEKVKLEKRGIQRYSIVDGVLVENDGGDIVKFLDHALEIGKMREENSRSYRSGYDSGKDSGYSWRL